MITDITPKPQAMIIHTAQGAWCCSSCGGFVREDARICKHCNHSFRQDGYDPPPTPVRVFFTLFGAGVIALLFMLVGMVLGGLLDKLLLPSYVTPIMSPGGLIGGLVGMAVGFVVGLVFIAVTLRNR